MDTIIIMVLWLVLTVYASVVCFLALLDWILCRKVQELKALIKEEIRKK